MTTNNDPRTYPDRPLVGVGGIVFQEDKVLLIRRGREPGRGKWSIPGGAVRLGETLEQALIREMREETGLEVEPLALVEVLDRIVPATDGRIRYHYILVDYLCLVRGGVLRAGSDADEAVFYRLEYLPNMALTPGVEKVVRKGKFFLDKEVFGL
ncbi:MAG: NUDIX hydrolase [Desulfobacterota bacterium]|jgi:ADP-ribose pyrophosphatase YjhB (NUDIX family)|nr:NUDIX hydrolase [Thermodesulfobacteriota bacterium]